VKYRDGILQDTDCPLNPRTRKVTGSHPSPARDSKANFYSPEKTENEQYEEEDVEDSFQHPMRATKNGGITESLSKLKG